MVKLLHIFNRYIDFGGEEMVYEKVLRETEDLFYNSSYLRSSSEWTGNGAPSKTSQLRAFFFNPETIKDLEAHAGTDCVIAHNIYPVISPSLYSYCKDQEVPVVQFIHNFRPFSVGGGCWAKGEVCDAGLDGRLWPEVWRGAWQGSRLKSALMAFTLRRAQKKLDVVKRWIAISDFMRTSFIRAGVPAERVVTLRHSWDAMPSLPDTRDNGYYLLLARLIPEKGIETALDAWEKMGGDAPRLVIAGTGPLEKRVQELAEKSDGKIEFAGFVDGNRKRELISNCRAMLAPSIWWEPLGLVTYEAYDYGKPMIAAASGGLTETIIDGVTGYLHTAGDAESLVRSVGNVESLSAEERTQMGREGRNWLLENADPEKWKSDFKRIIDEVILEHSAS